MKKLFSIFMLVVGVLFLTSCTGSKSVVGTWVDNTGKKLVITSGNQKDYDNVSGYTLSSDGDKLGYKQQDHIYYREGSSSYGKDITKLEQAKKDYDSAKVSAGKSLTKDFIFTLSGSNYYSSSVNVFNDGTEYELSFSNSGKITMATVGNDGTTWYAGQGKLSSVVLKNIEVMTVLDYSYDSGLSVSDMITKYQNQVSALNKLTAKDVLAYSGATGDYSFKMAFGNETTNFDSNYFNSVVSIYLDDQNELGFLGGSHGDLRFKKVS